jgi:GDSL-like Lipase/Acylhydrolase family
VTLSSPQTRPGDPLADAKDEWGWRDAIWLAMFFGFGGAAVFGVLLAVPGFDLSPVAWSLGVVVVVVMNLSLGSLAVGASIERVDPSRTRFRRGDKVLVWSTSLGLLAVDFTILWRLLSTGTFLPWGFLLGAVLSAVAGGVWSAQRAWPRNTLGPHQAWLDDFSFLSMGLGLAVGVVTAFAILIGSAIYHTWFQRIPGPQPPLVTSVTGSYVAIGDSYSAGEGLDPWATTVYGKPSPYATECHRSATQGYPELLMGPHQNQALLARPGSRDTACSGAIAQDVYTPRPGSVVASPQVMLGIYPGVALVTLTMGGNDILFSDVVQDCILHADCLTATFNEPGNDPIPRSSPERVAAGPFATVWAPHRELAVAAYEGGLFARLRMSFPNARIVVIGYPYLFPAGSPRLPLDCVSEMRLVSTPVRQTIRRLQDDFTTLIYEEAAANGVEYVSPVTLWDGHEPCGARPEFTNSVKPYLSFSHPIDGGSFHPVAAGQRALATVVACYLDEYRNRRDPFTSSHRQPVTISWPPAHPAQVGLLPIPGWQKPLHLSGTTKCSPSA